MNKIFVVCLFLSLALGLKGQGVLFFDSSFDEAVSEAKKQNKMLFIDVYADWCEPCKILSEKVFPLEEVGSYFRSKFVCYKMNADSQENKEFIKKYEIKGLPTLLFMDAFGNIVKQHTGLANPYYLIRIARLATGDQETPEEMYNRYKKGKKDLSVLQSILLDAPYFMPGLNGVNREKWTHRLKTIYKDYLKNKSLGEMINKKDFNLLTLFHDRMEKKDEIVDFMISHFNDYSELVDTLSVAKYITAMHSNCVIGLARIGDKDYPEILKRMREDMRSVYAVVFPDLESYYSMYNIIADANYALYYQKDTHKYIKLMNDFLQLQSDPKVDDYAMAVETLFNGLKGNLNKEGYEKSLLWLNDALKCDVNLNTQAGIVMTMGDCFLGLENRQKAKESYNQAYMLTLKMDDKRYAIQIQKRLKQKLIQLD